MIELIYDCGCGCGTVLLVDHGKLYFRSRIETQLEEITYVDSSGFLNGKYSSLPECEEAARKFLGGKKA